MVGAVLEEASSSWTAAVVFVFPNQATQKVESHNDV